MQSTLRPPSNYVLRDDIVTGTVQHNKPRKCTFLPESKATASFGKIPSNESHSVTRAPACEVVAAPDCGPIAGTTSGNTDVNTILDLLKLGQRIKRQKDREAQRRYKKKQQNATVSLEQEIKQLQLEINQLEQQRRGTTAGDSAMHPVWNAAIEYFLLFYRLHPDPQLASTLLEFVRTAMTPDAMVNECFGTESMVRSWRVFQCFDDVEVKLENLHKTGDTLFATTKASVTITEQTIGSLFPHLRYATSGSASYSLAQELLNQQLVLCGLTSFLWDSASDRVARVVIHWDMLTPMLCLLGSLEAVSRVFENALISLDCQWK